MARTDFRPGAAQVLNGPHVLAILGNGAADELASAIVPVISTVDAIDAVVSAVAEEVDHGDVDVAIVQFVGSIMVASLRGRRFEVAVTRADGVEAVFRSTLPSTSVEIRESNCAVVELRDADYPSDGTDPIPLPLGWQTASVVIYRSDATLTSDEEIEWLEHSTASGRFDPPPLRGLEFSDGRTVIVDRTVLIGRSPRVDQSDSDDQPAVVAVKSPQRDVSRTHLRITADGGRVLLKDLNSTNGTEVRPVVGAPFLLEPGASAVLEDGMVVSLGEHVAFTVVTAE